MVARRALSFARISRYDREFETQEEPMSEFHSLEMRSITGEPVSLSKFQENLCLIVNVASR